MRKPGLVVATLIGVAILIGLGWWQKERLDWKTAKLAAIDQAADAPPLTSTRDFQRLYDEGVLDFRRVQLRHDGMHPSSDPKRVFRAGGGINWEVFAPFRFGDDAYYVSGPVIGDDDSVVFGDLPNPVIGYVRAYAPEDVEGGTYSQAENRWYGFNPDQSWTMTGWAHPLIYIDAELGATNANDLPPRKPDLPNNHLQYMLTWWSFAVILVIISTILYRRDDSA